MVWVDFVFDVVVVEVVGDAELVVDVVRVATVELMAMELVDGVVLNKFEVVVVVGELLVGGAVGQAA